MSATTWLLGVRALIALCEADPTITAIEGCKIVNGPVPQGDQLFSCIYIGWNGERDDDSSGDGTQTPHDLGLQYRVDDSSFVEVFISGYSGSDLAEAQDRAFALFDAFQNAVRTSHSLTGINDELAVYVSAYRVVQAATKGGFYCGLPVRVQIDSLL